MNESLSSIILDELKCAECNEYLSYPPIYQSTLAMKANNICGRAHKINEQNWIRNTAYESIAAAFFFPCIYKEEGCTEEYGLEEMKTHEENCMYRKITCADFCDWEGKYNELFNHYIEEHDNYLVQNPHTIMFDLKKSFSYKYLMKIDDKQFFINFDFVKSENKIHHNVKFLGDFHLESCFKYHLKATNENNSLKQTYNLGEDLNEFFIDKFVNMGTALDVCFKLK